MLYRSKLINLPTLFHDEPYLQRVMGMDYLTTQRFMKLWFTVLWISGWGFATGVLLFLIDFFSMGGEESLEKR